MAYIATIYNDQDAIGQAVLESPTDALSDAISVTFGGSEADSTYWHDKVCEPAFDMDDFFTLGAVHEASD